MKLDGSFGQQRNPIDLSNTTDVECEQCGSTKFSLTFKIKKVSALVSPNGQEGYLPVQTYECASCGHINKDFEA
tara:strand:+ start:242 stop:463 length:222 start_codon:yes stop_codon:yes gene_type:complete